MNTWKKQHALIFQENEKTICPRNGKTTKVAESK